MISSSPASNNYLHPIWKKSNEQRIALLEKIVPIIGNPSELTALDVGAGNFEISEALSQLGFRVTALEPRKNNNPLIRSRIEVVDSTIEDYRPTSRFDIVLALGLVYHLRNPQDSIKKLASLSKKHIVIDSVVLDCDIPVIVYLEEDKTLCGNSVDGFGCRPSPKWILDTMQANGFKLFMDCSSRIPDIDSDGISTGHCYSWEFQKTCGWRRNEKQLRKFFIFERDLDSVSERA